MAVVSALSKRISRAAFPAFDWWDKSDRLAEWKRLCRSQWLTPGEIEQIQLARAQSVLRHAWDTVPYYREFWPDRPTISSLAELQDIPILTKQMIREAGPRLLSTSYSTNSLISAKTGGSTGTALRVHFDYACQQHRNAAALRSDSWAGWQPGFWVGGLWGSPERPATLKQRARNWLRDRIEYLDTMRLDATSMNAFLDLMRAKPLDALFGHSHSLFILADFVERSAAAVPTLRAIVSTSMMLITSERTVIERAFRCKVTDRYGCEEVGLIAAECEQHRGLHVNAEHTFVEIVNDAGAPCAPGEIGRVIVTDLQNKGMPLIRYEVGDLSAWAMSPCTCGRSLRTLDRVVGRQADCLVRVDGSLVAGVSLVERTLTAISGIAQLQLEQTSTAELVAHVVRDTNHSSETDKQLVSALTHDLGQGIKILIKTADRIPQENNGKYRFAIRRL